MKIFILNYQSQVLMACCIFNEHLPIIYLYFKGFVILSSFNFDFKNGTIYDVPFTPSFKEILFNIIFKLLVFFN